MSVLSAEWLELAKDIAEGEEKIYVDIRERLNCDDAMAVKIRRAALELYMDKSPGTLKYLELFGEHVDWGEAEKKNINNPIGGHPYVGWAGNLRIHGEYLNDDFFPKPFPVIMVADENQVIAGTGKGISVLNEAGGIRTKIYKDAMTRDVTVMFSNPGEAIEFAQWIGRHKEGLGKYYEDVARGGRGHGKFVDLKPIPCMDSVHLRYAGTCGSAMAMNDVTERGRDTTVYAIEKYLEEDLSRKRPRLVIGSGNMCTDKKASHINILEGRGLSIAVWATIPSDLIRKKLTPKKLKERGGELTAKDIEMTYKVKVNEGGYRAGNLGNNSNVANTGYGLFQAFGQDKAQVTELSLAYGSVSLNEDGDLELRYDFPAIEVGTIGGATRTEQARELLDFLGFEPDDEGISRKRLGEYFAAVMTVNDFNLIALQAAGALGATVRRETR